MKKVENDEETSAQRRDGDQRPAHIVHLPGFLGEEGIGLGDVIKRATFALGIKPCGGCEQRAAALNRWMALRR